MDQRIPEIVPQGARGGVQPKTYPASMQSTDSASENSQSTPKEDAFSRSDEVLGVKLIYGFLLPGHGSKVWSCGEFYTVGCLDHGYIEVRVKSCFRADCPVCRQKWAGRLAGRAEHRISHVRGLGPAKHIIVSVPLEDWGLVETDYPKLRSKVYKIAKRVGTKGGCVIFHPFRRRCPRCGSIPEIGHKTCFNCGNYWFEWYFSPHFHIIGFGWIEGTGAEYLKSGYIVKNIGRRKSIGGTVFYQLSHCGVHLKYHTITWFGSLSYNKLKVEPEYREGNLCPTCRAHLIPCRWFGEGEDPLRGKVEGGYWVDPAGWRYTARYRDRMRDARPSLIPGYSS
ncbi:hypothetical protein ES703_107732 [subsurface metagenome]